MESNPNKIKKITVTKSGKTLHYKLKINNYEYIIDDFLYQNILPYTGKIVAIKDLLDIISFSKAHDILVKQYKRIFSHTISKYDFKGKLMEKDIPSDDIDRIVDKLISESYLNDDDFIKHYLDRYQQSKGINAFKRFLMSKHIPSNKIDNIDNIYIEDIDAAFDYAQRYVNSKVGSDRLLRQKAKIALLTKGYTDHTVALVLDKLSFGKEKENLEKDVIKYVRKYPDDYYKVLSKLVGKGYNKEDVRKALKEEGLK